MSHLHHSTTTPAKRAHYITNLSSALLSGSWSSASPGKPPNASSSTSLDWSELVRKWGKHTEDDGVEASLVKGLREVSLVGLPMTGLGAGEGYRGVVRGYDVGTGSTRDRASHQLPTEDTSAPSSSSSDQSNVTAASGVSNSTSSSSFIHVPHPHLPSVLHRKDKHKDEAPTGGSGSKSAATDSAGQAAPGSAAGSSVTQRATSGTNPNPGALATSAGLVSGGNTSTPIARTDTMATSLRAGSPIRPNAGSTNAGIRPLSTPAYLDGDDTLPLSLSRPPACFSPALSIRSPGSAGEIRTLAEHASAILAGQRQNSNSTTKPSHGKHLHGSDVADRAALLLGYAQAVLGEWEIAREVLERVDGAGGLEGGTLTGDAMRLEYGRGRCLLAMAYEVTQRGDAFAGYVSAIQILGSITTLSLPSSGTFPESTSTSASSARASPRPSTGSFEFHKEVHRWLSIALTRATILSASGESPDVDRALRVLRTYHLVSKCWPSGFKPNQRSFMLSLYIRTLHARPPSDTTSAGPEQTYLITPIGKTQTASRGAELWQREAIDAIRVRQAMLTDTTSFPRAGQVNSAVEYFVRECVALWEISGCGLHLGREVIQILWWSMSLTFHSQPILRHLTRLLQATGSVSDAKRTFELYVQLVLKARQTEQPDQPLRLQKRPTGDDTAGPSAVASSGASPNKSDPPEKAPQGDLHGDSDDDFVHALLMGARLLSKDLDDPEDGWRYVVLAGDVLAQSRSERASELGAKVEECKGIIRVAMAVSDEDPLTRPVYQAQGLDHLAAALTRNPKSSALMYHLAYARAEVRDIDQAISAAHHALELDTENIEAWHLLALLLTAQKDWQGALKAVQAGIETWEQIEEEISRQSAVVLSSEGVVDPSVQPKDFALTGETLATMRPREQRHDPSSSTALLTASGITSMSSAKYNLLGAPLTASRRLARVIQLRMTQAVIVEKLEGPGAAMWRQQDTFSYFSARSGYSRPGGADANGSVVSGSVKDLGESYIAVPAVAPTDMGETVVLSPPTGPDIIPSAPQGTQRAGSPVTSAAGDAEYDTDGDGVKRSSKRLHLHVPGRHPLKRTASHASVTPSEARHRAVSNASATTTPAHSHYHGARPAPPPPPQTAKLATSGRSPAEIRVLSNLWLQSAATFRRWGKLEQALGAIQEAEVVDPENPEVWLQLGLYWIANRQAESALEALSKGLILRPDWPPIVVRLAQHHLSMGSPDLAHGLLNPLTQGRGWDVPEAWYWLAKTCEAQGGREERVRECLVYGLQLEKGRTCRPVGAVLDRWL